MELRSFPGRCWIFCNVCPCWPRKQHPWLKVWWSQHFLWRWQWWTRRTAFVSLSLFNTLQGPFFLLPYGVACIIQVPLTITGFKIVNILIMITRAPCLLVVSTASWTLKKLILPACQGIIKGLMYVASLPAFKDFSGVKNDRPEDDGTLRSV